MCRLKLQNAARYYINKYFVWRRWSSRGDCFPYVILALDILSQHCLLTAKKVLAYSLDFIDQRRQYGLNSLLLDWLTLDSSPSHAKILCFSRLFVSAIFIIFHLQKASIHMQPLRALPPTRYVLYHGGANWNLLTLVTRQLGLSGVWGQWFPNKTTLSKIPTPTSLPRMKRPYQNRRMHVQNEN